MGCGAPNPPLLTVSKVDLKLYSGEWIEIARYDNRFETGCTGATAHYQINGDHVKVINSCYDENGKKSAEAIGRAHVVDDSNNSKLRVSFFRPFYGDYWVLMLGSRYQYSVVGDPNRKYLWILSRSKELDMEDRKAILEYLPTVGYDVSKLHWTTVR